MSFPLPDFYLGICALLFAMAIKNNHTQRAILFGFLTASALIFFALNGFMFGIYTGILFIPSFDETIEIIVKILCLSSAAYIIQQLSNELGLLLRKSEVSR